MRRLFAVAVIPLVALACKKAEAPKPAPPAAMAPAPSGNQPLRGKVLEKVDVSQYSYVRLGTASGEVWAAVERTSANVGDELAVANAFPMQNFESKELGRKFDVV